MRNDGKQRRTKEGGYEGAPPQFVLRVEWKLPQDGRTVGSKQGEHAS